MLPISGRLSTGHGNQVEPVVPLNFIQSAYVDEEYLVIGSNVDEDYV